MRVFIAGIDGYIGWPLALNLAKTGYAVAGVDNGSRRDLVGRVGGRSAIPILELNERVVAAGTAGVDFKRGDIRHAQHLEAWLDEYRPDTIVQLGEQPSAPFSMANLAACMHTQRNNLEGTLNLMWLAKRVVPGAHIVKLGSMGEYGTPERPIPEAPCSAFPRAPGSFYHASKVHGSVNLELACKAWGEQLSVTDVMQGVVYGNWHPALEDDPDDFATRCDVDECFGTVIHRFCAQAVVGHPLTVYGEGGQTRGYLPLRESIECLTRIIENPPGPGVYRPLNQLAELATVNELAELVQHVAEDTFGTRPRIDHIDNPRVEAEQHTYAVDTKELADLGYEPRLHMAADVARLLEAMAPHRERIPVPALSPEIQWQGDLLRKGLPLQ